jgi:hypothetical protein
MENAGNKWDLDFTGDGVDSDSQRKKRANCVEVQKKRQKKGGGTSE